MNEQQIINRARGAYTDAPGSAIDVDGIVRAGQRRRRRRNVGTTVGAAALVTVLAGGAVGLATLDGSGAPTTAAPASSGPSVEDGCTRTPERCDSDVVVAWAKKHVPKAPAASFYVSENGPGGTEAYYESNVGEGALTVTVAQKRVGGTRFTMAPKERHEVDLPSGPTAEVADYPSRSGDWYVVSVPAGDGHGAVEITLSTDDGTTWDEKAALDLVDTILTAPPGPAPDMSKPDLGKGCSYRPDWCSDAVLGDLTPARLGGSLEDGAFEAATELDGQTLPTGARRFTGHRYTAADGKGSGVVDVVIAQKAGDSPLWTGRGIADPAAKHRKYDLPDMRSVDVWELRTGSKVTSVWRITESENYGAAWVRYEGDDVPAIEEQLPLTLLSAVIIPPGPAS